MTLPSDELHKTTPINSSDFSGITVQDALKVQKVIRGRAERLKAVSGNKIKEPQKELNAIDLALSVYISDEISKQEG
jgi:hypothetical protein